MHLPDHGLRRCLTACPLPHRQRRHPPLKVISYNGSEPAAQATPR
jgi:hypothetical protein